MFYKKIISCVVLSAALSLVGCGDNNQEITSQYKSAFSIQNEDVSFKGYNVVLEPSLAMLKRRNFLEKNGFPISRMLDENLNILDKPQLLDEENSFNYGTATSAYRLFLKEFTPHLETTKSSYLKMNPVNEDTDHLFVARKVTSLAIYTMKLNAAHGDSEMKKLKAAYDNYLSYADDYNKTLFKSSLISSGYMFTEFESDNDRVLLSKAEFDEENGDLIRPADKGLAFYIFTHGADQQDILVATLSSDHDKKTLAELYSEAETLKTDVVVKDIADIFAILESNTELLLKPDRI